jgi:bifunctional DNA-binding transcriptional regulator/antitoxin component of YhaV-PrlF toxin-antitoxin module
MADSETVLGTSKVDPHYRITLVQPLPELLGVRAGDLIVFVRDEEGRILIRPSSVSLVTAKRK